MSELPQYPALMEVDALREAILAALPDAEVIVDGDGRHFTARVISGAFAGKSRVMQHQMIYQALGDKVGKEVHALSIQTFTPQQWEATRDLRAV